MHDTYLVTYVKMSPTSPQQVG